MQRFTNLECHNEPETALFPQETELLLELISGVLEKFAPNATRGTFILDGQKYGEEAACILRFNLSEGQFRRSFYRMYSKTSDHMAEESIDEMLAIPGKSRYSRFVKDEAQAGCETTGSKYGIVSGVYRSGELLVLVLNATHGRFLMSCHLEEAEDGGSDAVTPELVLYAVAQAIAVMGKEDAALQYSDRFIHDCSQCIYGYAEVRQYVEDAFKEGNGPAMAAWRAWHEPANANGGLTLFFE